MELTLFWGDLHRHSSEGDGQGLLTRHFAVARDVLHLDFMAMTNCGILTRDPMDRSLMGPLQGRQTSTDGASMQHLHDLVDLHRVAPEHWALNQRLVREHTEPGRFVPFLGYEWSCARYGDRNVYYRHADEPMRLAATLPQLYRKLEQADALLIPHHPGYAVGRRGVDWSSHHPRLERLVEIVSNHGCSEEPRGGVQPLQNIGMGSNVPGSSVRDAWGRGLHLGVVAGSDCHQGPHEFLLTGLYAESLTPDAVWQALWHRRTVATTGGQRIRLEFRMDGEWQGSLLTTDSLPAFSVRVEGTAPILRVELVSNGEVLSTWPGSGSVFTLHSRVQGIPERPDNYYYIRVVQTDGNLAWSSPIWVSYLPELPEARGFLYWLPREKLRFEVIREQQREGRALFRLRCVNDDLEAEPVMGVNFEVRGSLRAEPLDQVRPLDLAPGQELQRAFALPAEVQEGEVAFGLRYTDANANRRLTIRRFPTHEAGRRR